MSTILYLLLILRYLSFFVTLVTVFSTKKFDLVLLTRDNNTSISYKGMSLNIEGVRNELNKVSTTFGKETENKLLMPERLRYSDSNMTAINSEATVTNLKEEVSKPSKKGRGRKSRHGKRSKQPAPTSRNSGNSDCYTVAVPSMFKSSNGSIPYIVTSLKNLTAGHPLSTFYDKIVLPTSQPAAKSDLPSLDQEKNKISSEMETNVTRAWRGSSGISDQDQTLSARALQQKRFDEFLQALDAQYYICPEFTINHIPHKESGLGNVIRGVITTSFLAAVSGRTFHSKRFVCCVIDSRFFVKFLQVTVCSILSHGPVFGKS